jgi:hypothetical protein
MRVVATTRGQHDGERARKHAGDRADRRHHHHGRGGDDARYDEVLNRADAHGGDGVDLLGHPHVSELARHRAARARGDHDARKYGCKLPREGESNDAADHSFRRELAEADDAADREGHSREEPHEAHDERGARADELERDEKLGGPERPAKEPDRRLPTEEHRRPEVVEPSQKRRDRPLVEEVDETPFVRGSKVRFVLAQSVASRQGSR